MKSLLRPASLTLDYAVTAKGQYKVIQITNYLVKYFVHQLRLHHLRNINDYTFSFTCHPAGLGVGAASAR